MSSGEKKVAAVLVVVLVAMVVAYFAVYAKTGRETAATQPGPAVANAPAGHAAAPASQAATPAGHAPAPTGASGAAGCAPTGASGASVATQEFGKKGAKLEIVAALPITHGCHVQTEAELKKAYEKHPSDIHLVIYDLFGPEGQKFVAEHGGQRAVVLINGKSSFKLNGKDVKLEVMEGCTYVPADILPIVEQELAKPAQAS
jgi:hypothetical protein